MFFGETTNPRYYARHFDHYVDELVNTHRRGFIDVHCPIFSGYLRIADVPELKRLVHAALDARAWFGRHGPAELQPLPLTVDEHESILCGGDYPMHLVGLYSNSLRGRDFDYLTHPLYFDYARGVMARVSEGHYLWPYDELRAEFPPKALPGLDHLMRWCPLPDDPQAEQVPNDVWGEIKDDRTLDLYTGLLLSGRKQARRIEGYRR